MKQRAAAGIVALACAVAAAVGLYGAVLPPGINSHGDKMSSRNEVHAPATRLRAGLDMGGQGWRRVRLKYVWLHVGMRRHMFEGR